MQTTTVIPPHTQKDGYYQKVLTEIEKLEPLCTVGGNVKR